MTAPQLATVFHSEDVTRADSEANAKWLEEAKARAKAHLVTSVDDLEDVVATGRTRYQVEHLDAEGDHVDPKGQPEAWATIRVTAITDVDTP
jgi:hypothetical protein